MVAVVMMVMVMEKNLEDGIQVINTLETLPALPRETTSVSNVRRLDWKEARAGPSPQDWQRLPSDTELIFRPKPPLMCKQATI